MSAQANEPTDHVDRNALVEMLVTTLDEACRGPADPKVTWFGENKPDSGLAGVLAKVTAGEASTPPTAGGRTIAAHAAHATFHLLASAAWLDGDRSAADWESSWSPEVVDEQAWARQRQSLEAAHASVVDAIRRRADWQPLDLGGGIGAVAHAAYHLGAIRQIIRVLHERPPPE